MHPIASIRSILAPLELEEENDQLIFAVVDFIVHLNLNIVKIYNCLN